jgi:hypothetical protein
MSAALLERCARCSHARYLHGHQRQTWCIGFEKTDGKWCTCPLFVEADHR